MEYKLKIEPVAKLDIQNEINYYNNKQKGLGKKFHNEVKVYFKSIQSNPFFQVRYDEVHCLPLKTFPIMIHYTINKSKKIVIVRALINTSKKPNTAWLK